MASLLTLSYEGSMSSDRRIIICNLGSLVDDNFDTVPSVPWD